jgi:3-oxoacyl-[acyl-carrier-protein] synthase-3
MAVPDRVVTNADLEAMVDTSDEWIVERTGIRQRHVAAPDETSSDLATRAALAALADAGLEAGEIDLVICATTTGDCLWPATACLVQHRIGAGHAAAFDISAACSGFCYGLAIARDMVLAGTATRALVIGADTLTKHVDWTDRTTCILFGDGAGAVVVGPCEAGRGILASELRADGSKFEAVWLPAGGTRRPLTPEMLAAGQGKLAMHGAEVFKFAVRIMGEISLSVLARAGLGPDDVSLFVPHQANARIIAAAAERMRLTPDRVMRNVERYGNTSAASIPIALTEALAAGRVGYDDVLVLVGFGAGLTWGANVLRWSRGD